MASYVDLHNIQDVDGFLNFVGTIGPHVGNLDGRIFKLKNSEGFIDLADVIKRLTELYPQFSQSEVEQTKVKRIILLIKVKNLEAGQNIDEGLKILSQQVELAFLDAVPLYNRNRKRF